MFCQGPLSGVIEVGSLKFDLQGIIVSGAVKTVIVYTYLVLIVLGVDKQGLGLLIAFGTNLRYFFVHIIPNYY